ncbi:MAG: glycosyltransferase family 2 protein [Prevotellaceae bacterium]|jgi:glycosyltransferase involved in cell wall biosynthesis|nr:glycosyltransferase family 2 protein [Prevotellaceae bacterium]
MFSIIVPLYNKALYIRHAVDSILSQTFRQFELIIVNDGSTDKSLEVVQGINFSGVDVRLINQPNAGVSTARNNGVKAAKYDYVAFLDADDWWHPTFLEEINRLIHDFPEGAIHASAYYKVKNGVNIPARIGVPKDFERGYFDYCKAYSLSPWMPLWTGAVVIRKTVFNEMQGFNPRLKLGEDFDLWVRVALKYKVALINKPLTYYNQDVSLQWRAVGNLHAPETHMLWNLEYLTEEEQKNPVLKQLLDNLRVGSLLPYYLNKTTRQQAKMELAKVDWSKQPQATEKMYKLPLFYLKIKQGILQYGYLIKQKLLHPEYYSNIH